MSGLYRLVEHEPEWVVVKLPEDAGGVRQGFECVHQLENGDGQCTGFVFTLKDAIGRHGCYVKEDE